MTTRYRFGVQTNASAGTAPAAVSVSAFNKVYYVDGTNGSDQYEGSTSARPFATITTAISSAAAGDTIIIAPGTYSHTATISPKARQTFQAAIINPRAPTVSITATSALTGDIISLDVDGCRFIGIEFLAGHANQATLVDIADNAAVNGAIFDRCVFNGADKTTVVGIQMDDASFVGTGVTVVDCLFRDLTGTCLDIGVLGMPYAYIGYNQFAIDVDSGTGIALADTTAFATGKGYVIEHNVFTGFDATGDEVGITIAGTENTTGAGIIRNNYFAFIAAAAITIDKLSKSEVNNYVGDAATGGTLVDPGT